MGDRQFGVNPNGFFLDSETALDNIRKPEGNSLPKGFSANFDLDAYISQSQQTQQAQPSAPAQGLPQTQQPEDSGLIPEGMTFAGVPGITPSVKQAPAPVQEKAPEEEGFFTGVGKSLVSGVKQTAGSLYAAGATLLGDNEGVVESAQNARERRNDDPQALKEFNADIGRRQAIADDSLWTGIKNVAGAAYDNPEGAFQMVLSQAPNSAVALGSGAAGAATGAAIGTAVAGPFGTAVGGIAGFLVGLFGANSSLEIGGKAQDMAADNNFTEEERSAALKQGTVKGAVITGVDALTLGASKWIMGAANRAVEVATVKTLEEAGIDAVAAAARIKSAQKAAFEATATQGREATTDAMGKATMETMAREGMTAPEVVERVRKAQQAAMDSVNTLSQKAARGTAALALESGGEGIGEYLGELAATGKASPTEAVMEALSGLSMSLGELRGVSKIEKPGALTQATNMAGSKTDIQTKNIDDVKGSVGDILVGQDEQQRADELNDRATQLNDAGAMSNDSYMKEVLSNDVNETTGVSRRDTTLNALAAVYRSQSIASQGATSPEMTNLEAALTRYSILDEVKRRAADVTEGGQQVASSYVVSGEQTLSDFPTAKENLLSRMDSIAQTLPTYENVKRDERMKQSQPLTMEDLDAMPQVEPDQSNVFDNDTKAMVDQVKTSENPPMTASQLVTQMSTAKATDQGMNALGTPDKYGVMATVDKDGNRVYTHPDLDGYMFPSEAMVFRARNVLKAAADARKERIAQSVSKTENTQDGTPMTSTAKEAPNSIPFAKSNQPIVDVIEAGGDARSVLQAILNDPNVLAWHKKVASVLAKLNINPKVSFGQLSGGGKNYQGMYYLDSDSIVIDREFAEDVVGTFLHEYVHAMARSSTFLNTAIGKQIEGIYARYAKFKTEDGEYGFENADEFLAEALTNLEFQKLLKTLKVDGVVGSLWNRIVAAFSKLFGVQQKDLIEKLLDAANSAAAENDANRKDERIASRATGDFSPSIAKPTVTDLVKALPAVVKDIVSKPQKILNKEERTDKATGEKYLFVSEGGPQSNSMSDLLVLVKRRMANNENWKHLQSSVTPSMLRVAYEKAQKSIEADKQAQAVDEGIQAGTYASVSAEETKRNAEERKAKAAEAAKQKRADEQKAKESKAAEQQRKEESPAYAQETGLKTEIRKIWAKATDSSFYQSLVDEKLAELKAINDALYKQTEISEFDANGNPVTFRRRIDGADGMERQVEQTGRISTPDDYYEQFDQATYGVSDSRPALLARKRKLEIELRTVQDTKVNKMAQLARMGLRDIRKQIDVAIQNAVKNGLPVEKSIEIGREIIGGIDNYLRLGNMAKFEKQQQMQADLAEFMDNLSKNEPEIALPTDDQFAGNLGKEVVSGKTKAGEAMAIIDEAQTRGELNSKKNVVEKILDRVLAASVTTKTQSEKDSYHQIAMEIAAKAKKDGLLRFDEFKDLFGAYQLSVPQQIAKLSEVAMSHSLMAYVSEHNFDPSARYSWLASMDRSLRFNPKLIDSGVFSEHEIEMYQDWKSDVSSVSNRRKDAANKGNFANLLFNKYSVEQMRNPSTLPVNVRETLSRMHPDLVEAYFADMMYADRNGAVEAKDVYDQMSADDKAAYDKFVENRQKRINDAAEREVRMHYFKLLSQFGHIDEQQFNALHKSMLTDQIANLPMIYDMALAMEQQAIQGRTVDAETGEILGTDKQRREQAERDFARDNSGEVTRTVNEELLAEPDELADADEQALVDMYVAAMIKPLSASEKDGSTVGDATLRARGVYQMLDIGGYTNAKEGRFVSFDQYAESVGEEDGVMESDDIAPQFEEEMPEIDDQAKGDMNDGGQDDARLRQGRYVGFLNTALVSKWVSDITKNWANAPRIQVLQSHLQLPENLREQVAAKLGRGMGAKGLFDPSTGTIYLFSHYLTSRDDTQFTLFHEAYGHLGLRLMFGQEFDTFLENMYNSNAAVRAEVDTRMATEPTGKLEAIEEALSDFAGQGKETGAVKQFVGKVVSSLRKIGMDRVANFIGNFTDAELSYTLQLAREYAKNGGGFSPLSGAPSDIRLSASEFPPYEVFAKKGINTTGYARYDPFINAYYLFTATNGDIRTGSNVQVVHSLEEVVAKMDKMGKLERRRRSGFYRDNKIPHDFVSFLNSQRVGKFKQYYDTFIRSVQNQYLPVFRVVEQMEKLGRVDERIDLRKFLTTHERRTAAAVEDYNKNYVTPIMKLLEQAQKSGGKFSNGATNIYEMLNKFLLAQHADERNIMMAKRNPEDPNFNGSGMNSDFTVAAMARQGQQVENTARDIMEFVASQPYAKEFEAIGKKLDALSRQKTQFAVKSGLMKAEDGEAMMGAYEHYRNLSGLNSEMDDDYSSDPSLNIGRMFNLRGKDKYATGRGDEAPDILARTLVAGEAAIIRGYKNQFANRVLEFFETNYDPNFVSINEQSVQRVVNKETGFVETRDNSSYFNQPDVFVAKYKGVPVTIRFKDAGYNSVAEALHGAVTTQDTVPWMNMMRLFNRGVGSLITKYNPFWIAVNFVRDIQTLMFNAGVNEKVGAKMAAQMIAKLPSAMATTLRIAVMELDTHTKGGEQFRKMVEKMIGKPDPKLLAAYQEGRRAGAFTSFINNKDLESQVQQINAAINGKSTVEKMQGFLSFWEVMTLPVEMAPRLAAYSVMRDNGRSTLESADYSGQVTVDFNMRGNSEWLRSAYLFFNPAVQGTAQILKLAKENPKRFAIAGSGLVMIGFLSSMLARMSGDEGDEERKRKERGLSVLDEIPTYKRATSLILFPNTRGGAIPVAYGWNAFFAAGAFLADSVVGNVPWKISAKRTIDAAFNAFSPVGGAGFDMFKLPSDPGGQLMNLAIPTMLAPISQWYTNTNRWGGPLYPNQNFGSSVGMSDTTKAFDSVNPVSRWLAENLQEATGGDRRNTKGIDINPALIDHLAANYIPGLMNEVYKGAGTISRQVKGLDTGRDKEPFFDRFSAYPQESFDAGAFRRISDSVHATYNEISQRGSTDPRRIELLKEHPGIAIMSNMTKQIEGQLRELRGNVRDAEKAAYMVRKSGQIERANKMDEQLVALRNKTKKAERVLFEKFVTLAARSGFKDEIYAD